MTKLMIEVAPMEHDPDLWNVRIDQAFRPGGMYHGESYSGIESPDVLANVSRAVTEYLATQENRAPNHRLPTLPPREADLPETD